MRLQSCLSCLNFNKCELIRNGNGNLSILCHCIYLFYGDRDEDVHACKGMGEEEEFFPGRVFILWLLFCPLGSICFSCNLPTKDLRIMVVSRLFLYCISDCLAERISMGYDVLGDESCWKIILTS